MKKLTVRCARVNPDATLPTYGHPGDAGADLCAVEDITLKPFERAVVPTGLAIALPEGYAGFVHPRSGLASKQGITVVNAPGTIDAGYRGEIKVPLINVNPDTTVTISKGDRIAQLVIQEVAHAHFDLTDELDTTQRGSAGFGSTGK